MTVASRITRTPSETRRLGERIGRMLRAGDVVLLSGELGAGKTVLAQGIGRGMGVTDPIKSSSFVIMNEYDGRELRLFHADLYRLEDPQQVAELALDELASRGVLVVEWPERAEREMPPEHLRVKLAYAPRGAQHRNVTVEARGERYKRIERRVALRRPKTRRSVDEPLASELRRFMALCDERLGTLEARLIEEMINGKDHGSGLSMDRDGIKGCHWVAINGDRAVLRVSAYPTDGTEEWLAITALEGFVEHWELIPKGHWMRIERILKPETAMLTEETLSAYERSGFEFFYTEHEMHRGLTEPMQSTPTVADVAIAPWVLERDSQIRDAYNDSFRDRGFAGYDEHEWVDATFSVQDAFRQDLSFLAMDGEDLAGFCLCAVDNTNSSTAWIDTLGVRPAHRGRGIATALLTRAMSAMRDARFAYVTLRVNEDNEPARRLYERLGFKTVKKHVVYRKRI